MDRTRGEPRPAGAVNGEFVENLRRRLPAFTPRQRVFAEYVLRNPESPAFLSISEMARAAGVSEATIVRFCNRLGYEGYAQLSREVQQTIQFELGTVGRFRLTRKTARETPGGGPRSAFERFISHELESLANLAKSLRTDDFYRCAALIGEADRVAVVGCMASAALAIFCGSILGKIHPQVDVLTGHSVMTGAVLRRLTGRSVALLISFPRYPRATVEIGRLAAARGARVVAVTDSHVSPVVPLAHLPVYIPIGIPSFADAYAAPIAFISALVTELSERNPEASQEALAHYDDYVSRADLFMKAATRTRPRDDTG